MSYEKALYFLVALQILVWTILPTVLRHSLPMDAVEGYVWGQMWQFGYDRNPWLNAWLTALAIKIGGSWLVYLFSQLSVAACFIAVWQLGKKILNLKYALIAVLLLVGIQYYNLASVDFNDNVLEIGLWMLTTLYFYSACKEHKTSAWLLTGLFAGLAMMAKYYTLVLLLSMLMFLLANKSARKNLFNASTYLGCLIFLIIILPHAWWLSNHNFATINYALIRISDNLQNSIAHFALVQLLALILPTLLFLWLLIGDKSQPKSAKIALSSFDKMFLLIMALGPYLLTLTLALFFNMTLHALWGTPLLSLWPLTIVAFTQPQFNAQQFRRFLIAVAIVFSAFAIGYSYAILSCGYGSSANYPAYEIAHYIEQQWYQNHQSKIINVVGDRYTAGNFAYFAKDHPKVIIVDDAHPDIPKTSEATIFIWRAEQPLKLPKNLELITTKDFHWKRNHDKLPCTIGFAF